MGSDKARERERMWNKPQSRRSSSSLSYNSPNERNRTNSNPVRPDSARGFNRIDGRPVSWHSPGPIQGSTGYVSPSSSIGSEKGQRIEQERERNWNSPQPKWEYQVPRALSPLPPSPPVPGSGYGRPPPDWDPNKQYDSPSRSRHSSLTNGRRVSHERSRTSSLSDEFPPPKLHAPLRRAGTDGQIGRPHSPATSNNADEDGTKPATQRFGWTFPKRRTNLPPFEPDVESPQKRPSTPETSRPSSRLSSRPSLIPMRSPGKRNDEESSSTQPRNDGDGEKKGHRRSSLTFMESMGPITQNSRIEPVDLINADVEDLVPTDIESGK